MKITDLTEGPFGPKGNNRVKYGAKVATPITDSEYQYLTQHKQEIQVALDRYQNGGALFRGTPRKPGIDAMLVDPTKVERKAANTFNFMNLFQSNLQVWKKYPPRNRSLICSTSESHADSYAYDGAFAVLPFGNPLIGICPTDDWWGSYPEFGGPSLMNRHLNDFYKRMQAALLIKEVKDLPETKSQFFKALFELEAICKQSPEMARNHAMTYPFVQALLRETDWKVGLNKVLNPDENEFKAVPLSEFKAPKNREVWVSAPSILIDPRLLNSWLQFIKK